ncbi:MAG: flagellar basal body rod protein FlgC [Planctomycetaceae bacterium]
MLNSIDISTSALVAQRHRLNTIAGNIANAETTRNEHDEVQPFQRRIVEFYEDAQSDGEVGFRVSVDTATPFRREHDPGHPDAGPDGYVNYPNVELTSEFVNAMLATRAYEANVSAVQMAEEMTQLTLQILA